MKRETISAALGGLDDRFVSEAAVYAPAVSYTHLTLPTSDLV